MKHPLLMGGAALLLSIFSGICLAAGPYAPAADQPGSTAVSKDDPAIVGWATAWSDAQYGVNADAAWRTPAKALGKASGSSLDVVVLGDRGRITLTFTGGITNGTGADFSVFENSFSDTFLELAFVEVSSDGIHFFRFPNRSLTASAVSAYGSVDTTNINGLAGKYRNGFGTPFDLADLPDDPDLDKSTVRFVRIVDICGDGNDLDSTGAAIYDPHTTTGSGGFDLDGIAVHHASPSPIWTTFRLPDQPEDVDFRSPQFAVLPDGRFLFAQGNYWSGDPTRFRIQRAWADAATDETASSIGVDPSFLCVKDATTALIGTGGWTPSAVYACNPTDLSTPSSYLQKGTALQNYQAIYWQNPAQPTQEGWILVGTNGTSARNALTFLSSDGTMQKRIVDSISTYSSGLTKDAQGNVFVATYETEGASDCVYRFTTAQIASAITNSPLSLVDGEFLFDFQSASSLAVDGLGRIWASGWELPGTIEVWDPSTGAATQITPTHPALNGATCPAYSLATFEKNGTSYIAFLARDFFDSSREIFYGYAEAETIVVPNPLANWQSFHFGNDAANPSLEASLWGTLADPDGDQIPNLLEYALGKDPLLPEVANIALSISETEAKVGFSYDPRCEGLTLVLEASATLLLGSWEAVATKSPSGNFLSNRPGVSSLVEHTDGAMRQMEITESFSEEPRRFYWLRVQK